MIVVSDTTPLNCLILIGQIDLLHRQQKLVDLPQVIEQLQSTNFFISPQVLQSLIGRFNKPKL